MKRILRCLSALLASVALVSADITIRLSVKAVLNPATGNRQPGVSDTTFSDTVAAMNAMLDSYGRGYHIQWMGNALIDVGGLGQFNNGPSQYYSEDFRNDPNGGALKDQFENNAIASPTTYGWDSTAVNTYIVQYGGANWNVCSIPGRQIILVNGSGGKGCGEKGYGDACVVLHEIGHYFNLAHTFNGEYNLDSAGFPCNAECSCAKLIGGSNDGIADTIFDHECWMDQNDIAQGNFMMDYASLSASAQAAVDRAWNNVMSYHIRQHPTMLLTPDQLDGWSDSANNDRPGVRTGRTWFVDRNCGAISRNGSSQCGPSSGPFAFVRDGLNSAQGEDIVLIRAGNYTEPMPMTINKLVTLRSSRGNVSIGIP